MGRRPQTGRHCVHCSAVNVRRAWSSLTSGGGVSDTLERQVAVADQRSQPKRQIAPLMEAPTAQRARTGAENRATRETLHVSSVRPARERHVNLAMSSELMETAKDNRLLRATWPAEGGHQCPMDGQGFRTSPLKSHFPDLIASHGNEKELPVSLHAGSTGTRAD